MKINARNYAKRTNQKDTKCKNCKSKLNLQFHHTDYKNKIGITLCRECHKKEHSIKNNYSHNGNEGSLKSQ